MNNSNGNTNEFNPTPEFEGQIQEAKKITNQLVHSLGKKQRGWENIYLTLLKVKERQLYAALGLRSFTSYVNHLAKCAQCQPSYIWRTWEAGKYYHELTSSQEGLKFREKLEANGKNVGDEVLSTVKKIAGKDTERALTILENFAEGNLTKKDIHQLYNATKKHSQSGEKNEAIEVPVNDNKTPQKAQNGPSAPQVKASDILLALSISDPFGLYDIWKTKSEKAAFILPKGHRSIYEVLPEFPVKVPGVAHSRRMDALIVTNIDAGNFGCDQHEVTLRCIEIKVSEYDLKNDRKMGDYAPFANRCYLAVPDYMEQFASDYMLDDWGLLVYDPEKKRLHLQKEATKYEPEFTFRTLQTLAVKKLKSRDFYGR